MVFLNLKLGLGFIYFVAHFLAADLCGLRILSCRLLGRIDSVPHYRYQANIKVSRCLLGFMIQEMAQPHSEISVRLVFEIENLSIRSTKLIRNPKIIGKFLDLYTRRT